MKMMPTERICLLMIAAGCLFAVPLLAKAQAAARASESNDIAVLVNASNSTSHLSLLELRAVLLGERRYWKNHVPITIVLREPGSRERQIILAKVLGMDDAAFKAHWKKKLFRGEASSEPITISSKSLVLQYLDANPGAVTFLAGNNSRGGDVKVIAIDTRMPGLPSYPFR